jgi:hypothetical protein
MLRAPPADRFQDCILPIGIVEQIDGLFSVELMAGPEEPGNDAVLRPAMPKECC